MTRRPGTMIASRRCVLAAGAATALLGRGCASRSQGASELAYTVDPKLTLLEGRLAGGRLGVFAVNPFSGERLAHRAGERFAMCSTFKWVLAGLVLEQSEKGQLAVSERLSYAKADLVPHSPVTGPRLAEGEMTIAELCGATVVSGDNTAANLLLRKLGGPEEFTAALRVLGDRATRLDRWEVALNENAPGDARDTTTPEAMVGLMRTLLIGDTLSTASRGTLLSWMEASTTGLDRLRAGLPTGWRVGDKTGAGGNGANNDVAFAIAPAGGGERGLLIASYISAPAVSQSERNAVHRTVAEQAVERLLR